MIGYVFLLLEVSLLASLHSDLSEEQREEKSDVVVGQVQPEGRVQGGAGGEVAHLGADGAQQLGEEGIT